MKYSKKFYDRKMKKYRKINEAEVQDTEQPSPEQKSQGVEKDSVEVIMTKKNYIDSVKKLQEIDKNLPDEKTKQWIEILNGDPKNDKVIISDPKAVPAKSLLPTQNEIDFKQSLYFPLAKKAPAFGKQANFSFEESPKNALLIAQIGGKNYIIDGHHRWSGAYLVDIDCDMNCYIMSGFESAEKALKATQLAIAKATAKKKEKFPYATTDPNSINLLNKEVTEDTFKNKVKETIDGGSKKEEVISAFSKAGKAKNQDEIADYLWKNVLFMRENNPIQSPAPVRIYMPQTAGNDKNDSVVLDPIVDVINPLKKGEVNVKPNYSTMESHIIKTYEKFIQNWKK
jgi:hypothetical protein